MGPFVPLLLFVVEAILIVAVGETLLKAAELGGGGLDGKMMAVYVALALGAVMSVIVFLASRGGTPQTAPRSSGGHH